MSLPLHLPPELEPFREQILATRRPFVRAAALPARATTPWESKVGGSPYRPKDSAWPTASDGRPLFFLAQINFAEMPPTTPFPQTGIVQFFINDDDLYGMDFDDGEKQDTFRVLYFPEVVKDENRLQTDSPAPRDFEFLPHHPEESYPLQFARAEEFMPQTDYQFWQTFGADFFQKFGEKEWTLTDAYAKAVKADGHKIGGYAYFTQDDPRRPDDPMLLLFQLDSDEGMDLMWGDMGVGHFFIREADLAARDFSRVLYDWDNL